MSFDTCGSGLDTLLAVYTVDTGGALQAVTSNDDVPDCDNGGSRVSFPAQAGVTYFIAIDGKNSAQGYYGLYFPPLNDDFANPPASTADTATSAASCRARPPKPGSPPTRAHRGGALGLDRVDAAALERRRPDRLRLRDAAGPRRRLYRVRADRPHAGGDAGRRRLPTGQTGTRLSFAATAKTTYLVAVDAPSTAPASQNYSLQLKLAPANDDFANAIALSDSGGTRYESTTGAGRETGEPDHASAGGSASVWYSWRPARAAKVRLDTCNSSAYDTALAVYTGSARQRAHPSRATTTTPPAAATASRASCASPPPRTRPT